MSGPEAFQVGGLVFVFLLFVNSCVQRFSWQLITINAVFVAIQAVIVAIPG